MSDLQTDLTALDQLLGQYKSLSAQINAQQALILQAIRNGESSGDRIRDFLRVIGDWQGRDEKPLRDLETRLQGQSGQPILALEITYDNHSHQSDDNIELGSRNRTHLAFYLGKIERELSFDLNEKVYSIEDGRVREPRLIIPAKGHLQCKTIVHDFSEGDPNAGFYPHSELKWETVSGPLRLDTRGIFPQIELIGLSKSSDILPTRIYVGKEVENYFTNCHMNTYEREASLYSYINAAKILNLDVHRNLQLNVNAMIVTEKEKITNQIIEHYNHGIAWDNSVAYQSLLDRALKLGMHQEPKTVALGSGAKLDLHTYISEYCSKYNLKLPDEKSTS
jgi:hypothetical protein